MLDLNFVREHPKEVAKAAERKGVKVDVDKILQLDQKRRHLQAIYDELRAKKKRISPRSERAVMEELDSVMDELYEIDDRERDTKKQLKVVEEEFREALNSLPNPPLAVVPEGKGEEDNVEVRKWSQIKKFDFPTLDHVELARRLDLIDFERGAKVGGSGFYYLKNEAVALELALVLYALDFLQKKGYTAYLTPDLAHSKYYLGTGYVPRGPEAQTYEIKDQDLGLIATAEVTLAGLHAGEMLKAADLPKRLAGYSHCFRQEAGSYGKYSKGLYRVHQFTKVEMFAVTAKEDSPKMHEELLKLEEGLWQGLGIPYRVMEMCTGDLGAQAARKFDLEAWMPGRGEYGEVTSTANTTDYQARRLDIKYRTREGKVEFAHTLNGTAIASSRAIIAILENYQQKDGSVRIPDVLQQYVGGLKEIRR